jgi:signal transduction histidine kinase
MVVVLHLSWEEIAFMEIDLSYLTNILTSPPGNLLYHLVISLSLLLLSGMVIPKLNLKQHKYQARQILTGCNILLVIQLVLFSASLVELSPPCTMALLESLAGTLTIIWLIWLFQEDDPKFFLTGVNIFLTLALLIIGMIILILVALQSALIPLDLNMMILSWQFGSLLLITLGIVFTAIKRPPQWTTAVCILIMLAAGHGLEIFLEDSLELKLGAVRLVQMLSLPWSIVILQRFAKSKPIQEAPPQNSVPMSREKRVDTKPILIEYLLRIPLQKTQQEKYNAVARALSMSVLSDICVLIKLDREVGKVKLLAGYDLIREAFIPPSSFPTNAFPRIIEAWGENQTLKLSHLYTEGKDIRTLTDIINYPYLGNLLAYPLPSNIEQLAGGIILLSPYTNKTWDDKTKTLLDEIKPTLSQVLFSPPFNEILEDNLNRAKSEIQQLMDEKEALETELLEKEMLIQQQETALNQWRAKYQIEKLETTNRMERLQKQIEQLNLEKEQKQPVSPSLEQMRAKIRQLTNERDQLKSELVKANAKIDSFKTEKGQTGPIRLSMGTTVVSLDSIMANIRLMIASQLTAKNIDLEIINRDGHQLIKTDPELTQTILFGLLDNAVKASNPGGKIQVSQELSLETGMLLVEVTDYGEGLTSEEQKSLFSAQPEMTPGIGSIESIRDAIRAIRALNGKIWLKSKKGLFTTFRVQLPVRIID